jgi:hypothetical protein
MVVIPKVPECASPSLELQRGAFTDPFKNFRRRYTFSGRCPHRISPNPPRTRSTRPCTARQDTNQGGPEAGTLQLALACHPVVLTHRQQGVYHHVTGVDASSSASLAAYINTLTYTPYDKANKVVSGLYWCVPLP